MDKLINEAVELLRLAKKKHGNKLIYSCSLGSQGMVLIDLIHRFELDIRIVTLDTGRLPTATYELMDDIRTFYNTPLEVLFPDAEEVQEMVSAHGINLFYHAVQHRKMCCGIRKINPLQKVLQGMEAWITGRRKDQAKNRAEIADVEDDPVYGLKKYNPMRNWSEKDVWNYIREHQLPYNTLHDAFYASIGCEPCTRAISIGEDPRSGRWWWENQDTLAECGLHVSSLQAPESEGEQGEGI
ncbi:MAG: phosphoadenylyl-sulfate reductase [Mariprofundaceae bacterium]